MAPPRVTAEIAREICQRNGVKALLTGSIASVGNQYSLTLTAINAASNDTLAEVQDRADSKEQVLKALDSTASQMRQKLGESLASFQKFDKPLEKATTSSLEALKSYSLGDQKHSLNDDLGAVPFYKRAIELDPNFAIQVLQSTLLPTSTSFLSDDPRPAIRSALQIYYNGKSPCRLPVGVDSERKFFQEEFLIWKTVRLVF